MIFYTKIYLSLKIQNYFSTLPIMTTFTHSQCDANNEQNEVKQVQEKQVEEEIDEEEDLIREEVARCVFLRMNFTFESKLQDGFNKELHTIGSVK